MNLTNFKSERMLLWSKNDLVCVPLEIIQIFDLDENMPGFLTFLYNIFFFMHVFIVGQQLHKKMLLFIILAILRMFVLMF